MTGSTTDLLVGTLAIVFGLLATGSAAGVIPAVHQLRSIRSVRERWGDGSARMLLILIAVVLFGCGASILWTRANPKNVPPQWIRR